MSNLLFSLDSIVLRIVFSTLCTIYVRLLVLHEKCENIQWWCEHVLHDKEKLSKQVTIYFILCNNLFCVVRSIQYTQILIKLCLSSQYYPPSLLLNIILFLFWIRYVLALGSKYQPPSRWAYSFLNLISSVSAHLAVSLNHRDALQRLLVATAQDF